MLPDAPDPIEPHLLFLRGAAYLQQAVYMIESTIRFVDSFHFIHL